MAYYLIHWGLNIQMLFDQTLKNRYLVCTNSGSVDCFILNRRQCESWQFSKQKKFTLPLMQLNLEPTFHTDFVRLALQYRYS